MKECGATDTDRAEAFESPTTVGLGALAGLLGKVVARDLFTKTEEVTTRSSTVSSVSHASTYTPDSADDR